VNQAVDKLARLPPTIFATLASGEVAVRPHKHTDSCDSQLAVFRIMPDVWSASDPMRQSTIARLKRIYLKPDWRKNSCASILQKNLYQNGC
jgi:hypothetical protein